MSDIEAIKARHQNTRRNECLTTVAGLEAYDDRATLLVELEAAKSRIRELESAIQWWAETNGLQEGEG